MMGRNPAEAGSDLRHSVVDEVAMNALLLIRGTAAAITLIAGLFAVAVRFGPVVAPEHHEAAMITLAAVFGQDLEPTLVLASN